MSDKTIDTEIDEFALPSEPMSKLSNAFAIGSIYMDINKAIKDGKHANIEQRLKGAPEHDKELFGKMKTEEDVITYMETLCSSDEDKKIMRERTEIAFSKMKLIEAIRNLGNMLGPK